MAMKKITVTFILLILTLAFAACKDNPGTGPGSSPAITPGGENKGAILDDSLEVILQAIYDTANLPESFKSFLEDGVATVQINDDNIEYHLGKKGIEFKEAIASEPLIQPSAYSLCLVRVKEGADVEKIKKEIRDNVNPNKWVCIGVDKENVIVDSIGDVIFLVMSNEGAKPLHDAFMALKDK